MICLRFNIDDFSYCFDYKEIVEVVPWVGLTPVVGAPDYVLGYFNYRGTITPVIDLTMLIAERSCRRVLGSRIVVVEYDSGHLLGLLMEDATETLRLKETGIELQETGVKPEASFMGDIMMADGKSIQFVNTKGLLSQEVKDLLFTG